MGLTTISVLFAIRESLQGGWLNSDSVTWFEEYARVCFREFGDQVKMWTTFNEPWIVSMSGYGEGYFPPGAQNDQSIGTDVYTVTHNLIKSHARAYRMYHDEFAPTQNGNCHEVTLMKIISR